MSIRFVLRSAGAAALLACACLASLPASARGPDQQAVLDRVAAGDLVPDAVRGLLALAASGDADAARQAGTLYESGNGVIWDRPSALRWYAVAALKGDAAAAASVKRLWQRLADIQRKRAEALMVRNFTDADLQTLGIGPLDRQAILKSPWARDVLTADIAAPEAMPAAPASPAAPVVVPVPKPDFAAAVPASLASVPPLPEAVPAVAKTVPAAKAAPVKTVALKAVALNTAVGKAEPAAERRGAIIPPFKPAPRSAVQPVSADLVSAPASLASAPASLASAPASLASAPAP